MHASHQMKVRRSREHGACDSDDSIVIGGNEVGVAATTRAAGRDDSDFDTIQARGIARQLMNDSPLSWNELAGGRPD